MLQTEIVKDCHLFSHGDCGERPSMASPPGARLTGLTVLSAAAEPDGHHEYYVECTQEHAPRIVRSKKYKGSKRSGVATFEATTWRAKTRYSQLHQLHLDIVAAARSPAKLPKAKFPGKKWFGSRSKKLVEQRLQQLGDYLRGIAQDPALCELRVVKRFFQVSSARQQSKHLSTRRECPHNNTN